LINRLGGEHVLEFAVQEADRAKLKLESLKRLPSVSNATEQAGEWVLALSEPHVTIPALMDHLRGIPVRLAKLTTRSATLEDVFVTLTGRHLRDGDSQL